MCKYNQKTREEIASSIERWKIKNADLYEWIKQSSLKAESKEPSTIWENFIETILKWWESQDAPNFEWDKSKANIILKDKLSPVKDYQNSLTNHNLPSI